MLPDFHSSLEQELFDISAILASLNIVETTDCHLLTKTKVLAIIFVQNGM
jgi:hypothetical protein